MPGHQGQARRRAARAGVAVPGVLQVGTNPIVTLGKQLLKMIGDLV